GLILSKLLTPSRSTDNRLILAIALLLGISGLCAIFDVSPLLSCMVFGATYINTTHDKELYRQINNFTPPVMSMFFTISGMSLDIKSLSAFGLVGLGYFAVRIIGKYAGAYLGCAVTKTEKSIKNNLGVALIPQAGVAIGLAFLGQRILPPDIGNLLLTIVLSSSVLYELIGPICAKIALIRSGVITSDMLNRKTVLSSNTTPLPPDASVMPINPLDSIPNKVG
ncbi:MAG: cation:proton antiporter, partial [Angelakisella sp.]